MRRINLLPESVLHSRQRRLRRTVHVAVLGAAAVVLAGWGMVAAGQIAERDARISQSQRQLQPLLDEMQRLDGIDRERAVLQEQLTALKRLEQPVGTHAVLALISQLAPESAVLRQIEIHAPLPLLPEPAKTGSGRRRDASRGGDEGPVYLPVTVQLDGMAGESAAIAGMVDALSGHGLFGRVRLAESREAVVNDRRVHHYRITMEVPLDRTAAARTEGPR